MSERIRTLTAMLVIAASAVVVVATLAFDAAGPGDRVDALATRLKCPVCTSESVAASPAQVSRDLYALIEERVAEGWGDQEIIDFFVATYGDEVLLDPPAGGSTAVLWLAPLVALAIGGVIVAGRRAERDDKPLSPEQRAKVERALRDES